MRKVTITDIANEAGVNKSTVSIVLNDKPLAKRVADATKKRIFAAAEKLDYQPSLMAQSLASGKTNTIGIVLGGIGTPYGAEMAAAALEAADARGKQLLISVTKWDPAKELACLDNLMQRQVDGIIFHPEALTEGSDIYNKLIKRQFPMVLYDYELPGMSAVISDLKPGMTEAMALLKGSHHETVGFAYTEAQPTKKLDAFGDSAAASGLAQFTFGGSEQEITDYIAENHDACKAWILSSDKDAQVVMNLLAKHELRVPDDLDVISIDGTDWGAFNTPALTSIKQDAAMLMKHAVDLILNNGSKTETIYVPTSLIVRDSVKK